MSDLQMKLGNSLFESWSCLYISQENYCQRKTCVSIQNKCLEVIWSLNKLGLSIFSQEFTQRTLHQVLTMWIKTFQNANIKLQTPFCKAWIFTQAHMLLKQSALTAWTQRGSIKAQMLRIFRSFQSKMWYSGCFCENNVSGRKKGWRSRELYIIFIMLKCILIYAWICLLEIHHIINKL